MNRALPGFGLAVGVLSLVLATGNLAVNYWKVGFPLFFLGPIAFCGALVAFSHGSWRLALITGFLATCGSVLAVTSAPTLAFWQLTLLCGAIAVGLLLGWWLWTHYRKHRNPQKRPNLPGWPGRMQRILGPFLGAISVAMGLGAWLELDLAYCSFFAGHVDEEFTSPATRAFFIAPIAYLTGVTTIGCRAWRLGTLATCVSLGALTALMHALYSPADAAFFLLTFPLFLAWLPFLLPPLHPLYNPWILAILAAILFAFWQTGRRKNTAQ